MAGCNFCVKLWLDIVSCLSETTQEHRKDFTAELLLLSEKIHTLSVQYHCMNIVTNTINKVNPLQTPVDLCDQPIFTLSEQIQWRYPEKFGNYLCLFGGLHIEKSIILFHGDFLSGSVLFSYLESTICLYVLSRLSLYH